VHFVKNVRLHHAIHLDLWKKLIKLGASRRSTPPHPYFALDRYDEDNSTVKADDKTAQTIWIVFND
jgi:hypothetical protein